MRSSRLKLTDVRLSKLAGVLDYAERLEILAEVLKTYTSRQLAAYTKHSASLYSQIINGRKKPTTDVMVKVLRFVADQADERTKLAVLAIITRAVNETLDILKEYIRALCGIDECPQQQRQMVDDIFNKAIKGMRNGKGGDCDNGVDN